MIGPRTVRATRKAITNPFGDPALQFHCGICKQLLTIGNRSWPKSEGSPIVLMLRPDYHLVGGIWKQPNRRTGPYDSWRGGEMVIRNPDEHNRHMSGAAQDFDAGDVVLIECPQCKRENLIDNLVH